MNKKKIYGSAIAFLLSLFAACDMISPDPELISGHDGKATVHVLIGGTGTQGRTVTPPLSLQDVTAWELLGGKQGESATLLAQFSDAGGTTVGLDSGTWDFTLLGYKNDDVILTGSLTGQTISTDSPNTLNFAVMPVSEEGQGTLNLVVELPAGSDITTARVFKDGTEIDPVTPVDDKIVVTGTYPVGVYRFSIRLYNGNEDLYGVISEAVYVWANLESAKTYTLAQQNLNLTYLITYHLWDGQTETGSYQYTDAALIFRVPARPGYGFGGWYDNAAFSGESVAEIPTGSVGDRDFYAKWSAQYTVTFDAAGGSPAVQTRAVNSGESLDSGISNAYSPVSGSAVWTLLSDGRRQSPTIDHGGVTKTRISFATEADNGSITIQLDVSSESGFDYAFISTLDNANATYSGGYYARISGTNLLTNSVSVTIPVPTAGSHFIDIGYQKDSSASSGSDCAWFKVTGTMPQPTKTGYAFDGWFTQANGNGDQFTTGTAVNENMTVYAKWVVTYTVDFDAQGGTANPSSISVNEGACAASLPTATKSGYALDGWYTAPNGGGVEFTETTPVTGPITVYANWLPFFSDITYSGDTWTLSGDGRRQSPATGDGGATKARISFDSYLADAAITIQLDVSSESGADYAFISTLDDASATIDSGYYTGSKISGTQSVLVTIPVPNPGSHFIEVGYGKNDSSNAGSDCAWFKVINTITYSPVSGDAWTLLDDGRRRSPTIGHNSVTKTRISFTTEADNASITIQLDVSSESGYDYAFISMLDNADATYQSGFYTGSLISGTQSKSVTIPVPTAGDHFIDIGYRKDGSDSSGSDCAWFKVIALRD